MEETKDRNIDRTVTVAVNGSHFQTAYGTNLGEFLRSLKLTGSGFVMPCGGRGSCGKCRVQVRGVLSEPAEKELETLSLAELQNGVRLACRTQILGDCSVVLPDAEKAQIVIEGTAESQGVKALEPLFSYFGVAIDIGTTTVAARLYDHEGSVKAEAAAMNPQRQFGADVISRMEAALAGNSTELARLIRTQLSELIFELAGKAAIDTNKIDAAVITGNTVMLYLLTETDVEPLTHAPFELTRRFGEILTAKTLEISALNPETRIYLPPCAGAYIGADTVCAVLASGMCGKAETSLLTDIGTNGETVLKCENGLFACSTAAGPAFEGAGISMGMGGQTGAIDRVWTVSGGQLGGHVIGETEPAGICGSGLIDAIACLLRTEQIDETGYMEDDAAVILPPVTLTQKDVRQAQLAKSAICSGIRTLLKSARLREQDTGTLYIAGGFGSYLNVHSAGEIGLIPRTLTERVNVLGNAALAGASQILLSGAGRAECVTIAGKLRVVELANDPYFAAEYIDNMAFGGSDE